MTVAPKRRGRPPKPKGEKKRATLTLRMRDDLRSALEREATHNQRSLSEETELRLERSFHEGALLPELLELAYGAPLAKLLRKMGAGMQGAGIAAAVIATGRADAFEDWAAIPYAYDQALRSALKILEHGRPEGDPTPTAQMAARLTSFPSAPSVEEYHGLIATIDAAEKRGRLMKGKTK